MNPELLRTLWEEGLLIAPADQDELGESCWMIPRFIAETLDLGEIAFCGCGIGLAFHQVGEAVAV